MTPLHEHVLDLCNGFGFGDYAQRAPLSGDCGEGHDSRGVRLSGFTAALSLLPFDKKPVKH